jgi:hypothetical protein
MAYLFNSGLIEKQFDFTSYIPMDTFDITPTRLGLELFERCKGHRMKTDSSLDFSLGAQPVPESDFSAADEAAQPLPLSYLSAADEAAQPS